MPALLLCNTYVELSQHTEYAYAAMLSLLKIYSQLQLVKLSD